MITVAIHSHKGGVGKTTAALLTAKFAAEQGNRVCLVDLDFLGAGVADLLRFKEAGRHSFDDFLLGGKPNEFSLKSLLSTYSDDDLAPREISLVFNRCKGATSPARVGDQQRIVEGIFGDERRYGDIHIRTQILIRKLDEAGFDLVVLDCHPGLGFVSKSVTTLSTFNVYVTTPNRSDCFGILKAINWDRLGNERAVILLNRSEWDRTDFGSFQRALEEDGIVGDDAAALIRQLLNAGFSETHFLATGESELLRTQMNIGRTGTLPRIVRDDAQFLFCGQLYQILFPD